ncbi:MAG: sigma-70 family RNA polymerase sigma factor [Deltaproteobacteria bacterium]|nr:sigma-70 family RNA polymerase sigma factor [Deltaproteobacteria bacterium]
MADPEGLEDRIRAAAEAADWSRAATVALEGYGPEVLGFLVTLTRNAVDASEAFSLFSEGVWRGLPKFRWEASFRTWAYRLARRAVWRLRRDPHRRRAVPLSDAGVSAVVEQVRSRTATFLRTETRDKVAKLRAALEPDDQALLVLRVDKKLPWRDIARVLADDEDEVAVAELDRRAATLRKRFERVKADIRERSGRSE